MQNHASRLLRKSRFKRGKLAISREKNTADHESRKYPLPPSEIFEMRLSQEENVWLRSNRTFDVSILSVVPVSDSKIQEKGGVMKMCGQALQIGLVVILDCALRSSNWRL